MKNTSSHSLSRIIDMGQHEYAYMYTADVYLYHGFYIVHKETHIIHNTHDTDRSVLLISRTGPGMSIDDFNVVPTCDDNDIVIISSGYLDASNYIVVGIIPETIIRRYNDFSRGSYVRTYVRKLPLKHMLSLEEYACACDRFDIACKIRDARTEKEQLMQVYVGDNFHEIFF
ncbi:MAG: hypothetical protein LRY41_02520 [Candidatus Pacebacteria bacterium]|nr:hypothetical protein [Candidatus Paceibacterota bacterium]MCD8508191.1 hypothetical protein [Candidatus Paceibacterota bacterium]MCD8528177.1 hypothetical protein [Candidatus Paceibacterota bacterium]MCD8563446.1 hypothetical protein [Candidatus Paceibacterota bacterium]